MDEEVRPGQILSPAQAMRLAISEGAKGAGYVSPNPLVGCVILDRESRFLASGYHHKIGQDHAEVDAIKKVGDSAKLVGAQLFVTLEPCAHQGRTPSCAKTIAPMKVGSVTYAVEDPNPLVAGQGAAILREAGAKAVLITERADIPPAEAKDLAEAAEDLAEIFLHNMRSKEPFVGVKIGSTLDGKLALASGESKWITNEKSRHYVQALRASYDAVAIGRNTFVTDNPSLNVRHENFPGYENHVIIFDPKGHSLSSLAQSKVLQVRSPEKVLVVVDQALEFDNRFGIRLVSVPVENDRFFAIDTLLAALKNQGINSLMIEGGAQTVGAFFTARKVRRLHLFQAPLLVGGKHGISWSSGFGVQKMTDGLRLERISRAQFDDDSYVTGRVTYPAR